MAQLTGKVALVTGAAKGMGLAIARCFLAEGAAVGVAARTAEAAGVACDSLGVGAFPVALDVTSPDQWRAAMSQIEASHGKLNILVNCAGLSVAARVEAESDEGWRQHMAINLDGVFYGCRAALPLMKASGENGSIVNISSMFALRPVRGFGAYCASKAAMTTFTKVIALECAAEGIPIRVNCVHPGGTMTEMLEKALADTGLPREEALAHFLGIHPMKRMGQPEEVAAAALWLASDQSSFTTGADIPVDGGGAIRG